MRWVFAVLSSCVAAACSSGGDDLATSRAPVFGGAVDETTTAVVSLSNGPLGAPHDICSAIVLAPRLALTAAHCVDDAQPHHIQLGTYEKSPTRSIAVVEIAKYPGYRGPGEDQRAGYDLALLRLAEDVGVEPIALGDEVDGLTDGTNVVLVGFGQSTKTELSSSGVRNRVTAPITHSCDRLFGIGDTRRGFCGGDSGGAVLFRNRLVGVMAFGLETQCAAPGWAIRVGPYAAWIRSFVEGAGDSTCASTCPPASYCPFTQLATDADPVPEPPSQPADTGACAYGRAARAARSTDVVAAFAVLAALVRRRTSRRLPGPTSRGTSAAGR